MAYSSPEKKRASQQARVQRNKHYVDELRASTRCADCLQFFPPYCMDFDHLGNKAANVLDLVFVPVSLETLKAEIAKTALVCSNCHRMRTHNRRQEATP